MRRRLAHVLWLVVLVMTKSKRLLADLAYKLDDSRRSL